MNSSPLQRGPSVKTGGRAAEGSEERAQGGSKPTAPCPTGTADSMGGAGISDRPPVPGKGTSPAAGEGRLISPGAAIRKVTYAFRTLAVLDADGSAGRRAGNVSARRAARRDRQFYRPGNRSAPVRRLAPGLSRHCRYRHGSRGRAAAHG